jgi:hypothetical protein
MTDEINPPHFDRDGWCHDMAAAPDSPGVEYLYGPFIQDGIWWVTWQPNFVDAVPTLAAFGERMARPVAWRLPSASGRMSA